MHPQRLKENSDTGYSRLNKGKAWNKYKTYLHNQVRELLTNYGKIDIMWLDFSYPGKYGKGKDDWGSVELLKMIRQLQPGVIVDDRLDLSEYADGADFRSPEQVKPSELKKGNDEMPFETCQTFSGSWGYYRDENSWKTNHELLTLLITAVSKDGNLILNLGPTARGLFDYRAQNALDSIALWMKYNNRSIYGCKDAPESFSIPENTLPTYNPVTKRLYVHLMKYPDTHTLVLSGYKDKIKYVQFLHDASEITTKSETGNDLTLQLPERKPNMEIPVIEIMLN